MLDFWSTGATSLLFGNPHHPIIGGTSPIIPLTGIALVTILNKMIKIVQCVQFKITGKSPCPTMTQEEL
ncbi:hypothetical protein Krac_5693 [Ktedonobacter racemifer DSM 44963]|uniref:Uncharacterized protein n=1 Tax=Ktedonobacter racemifer DSM 44963 TaxID=485913 RepID=D6TWM8_KTERA|nr:hypothetical protein Krac_5693 [Ktedonobacter racemifer DSM 44963]